MLKCQLQVLQVDGELHVYAPYNEVMVSVYRALGGTFNKTSLAWVLADRSEVHDQLKKYFGWTPTATLEEKSITHDTPGFENKGSVVCYRGYVLATRRYRDYGVTTPAGVLAVGSYACSGGSMKNPSVMDGADIEYWKLVVYTETPTKVKRSSPLSEYTTEELEQELENRKQ